MKKYISLICALGFLGFSTGVKAADEDFWLNLLKVGNKENPKFEILEIDFSAEFSKELVDLPTRGTLFDCNEVDQDGDPVDATCSISLNKTGDISNHTVVSPGITELGKGMISVLPSSRKNRTLALSFTGMSARKVFEFLTEPATFSASQRFASKKTAKFKCLKDFDTGNIVCEFNL